MAPRMVLQSDDEFGVTPIVHNGGNHRNWLQITIMATVNYNCTHWNCGYSNSAAAVAAAAATATATTIVAIMVLTILATVGSSIKAA